MNKKTLLASFFTVFFILTIAASLQFKQNDRYFLIIKNLDIFTTLYKELNTYYVDEINPTDLIETGMKAMLESLDPYTNYIPEEKIEDYRIMSTGQYGGIGTAMGEFDDKKVVMMVFENSPAEKAGIEIGDEIVALNGNKIKDLNTDEINNLLKGQIGSSITVEVIRYGQKKPLTFEVKRQRISIESVPFYDVINEDIAYIRLTEFSSGAGASIRNALIELKDRGAKKLILDLRDNPGGLLNEAIEISNIFIPKGKEVVSTKGKIEDWNKTYFAKKNPVDISIPVAVLISNNSASASEIVAGVMQDYDRGILVGQRSFGKGLVQATRDLSYNSLLKVTTAKYYIPSGRCIQAIDYAKRNEDGTVVKIADSLKSKFTTAAGRVVYDGAGVRPDVEVKDLQYAPITKHLLREGFIFNYATQYYYKNQSARPDPKSFEISAELFNDFKSWLGKQEYDYVSETEKLLLKLEEQSVSDQYHQFLKDEIKSLHKQIENHKDEDVDVFSSEIKRALKEEVISRYYKRQGMIESSFQNDKEVIEAANILSDEKRYNSLLTPDS